ncbi:uncharacterized protein LOC134464569 [Engraulis encrasicolus]|uniref:uncharacterized protein LOC134464569 n=1 Tax=Engraulis encrasicolus TaxID=184585 RepID=UPI002FCF212A
MEDHATYPATSDSVPSQEQSDSLEDPPLPRLKISPKEEVYKLNDAEVEQLIKLKASNVALFSGRRNSAKLAWRTILKEMGLQGKLSFWQALKKWDNLRNKYNEIKNTPAGASTPAGEWRWFKLMDDALQGRLVGSAKVLSLTSAMNSSEFLPRKRTSKDRMEMWRPAGVDSGQTEYTVSGDDFWGADGSSGVMEMEIDRQEIEQERAQLDSDRIMVDREREVLERERMVLDRERAGIQREQASVERDRASLERARAGVDRERAQLDRRMARLETERAKLERQKLDLRRDSRGKLDLQRDNRGIEKEKERDGDGEKDKMPSGRDVNNSITSSSLKSEKNGESVSPPEKRRKEDLGLDDSQMEKRQKFLDLFEKLIEKF